MERLPEDIADYMGDLDSFLVKREQGIIKIQDVEKGSTAYQNWKNKTASLKEYLYAEQSAGWIDTIAV